MKEFDFLDIIWKVVFLIFHAMIFLLFFGIASFFFELAIKDQLYSFSYIGMLIFGAGCSMYSIKIYQSFESKRKQ